MAVWPPCPCGCERQIEYRWFCGPLTPKRLDASKSRFARRLNLLRITRSRVTHGAGA